MWSCEQYERKGWEGTNGEERTGKRWQKKSKHFDKKKRPFLNWKTWRKWWWCWWSPIYLLIRLNWEYYQKIIHLIFLLQLPFFIASAIISLNAYLTSAIPTRSLIEIKALHKTQWGFLFYCQCFSRKILRCPKTGSEPIVHFSLRFYPQYLLFFAPLVLFWQLSFFGKSLNLDHCVLCWARHVRLFNVPLKYLSLLLLKSGRDRQKALLGLFLLPVVFLTKLDLILNDHYFKYNERFI